MTTTAIREKLQDYIKVADHKKIKAIYTILKEEIATEAEWWKDASFVKELDKEHAAWESDKTKAYTLAEIDTDIEKLKKKRNNK